MGLTSTNEENLIKDVLDIAKRSMSIETCRSDLIKTLGANLHQWMDVDKIIMWVNSEYWKEWNNPNLNINLDFVVPFIRAYTNSMNTPTGWTNTPTGWTNTPTGWTNTPTGWTNTPTGWGGWGGTSPKWWKNTLSGAQEEDTWRDRRRKRRNKRKLEDIEQDNKEKMLKQKGKHDLDRDQRKFEREQELQDISHDGDKQAEKVNNSGKKIEAWKQIDKKDMRSTKEKLELQKEIQTIENELKLLETQWDISDQLLIQEWKNKIAILYAEGKRDVARRYWERFIAFFKGFNDVTHDDINFANNALELAKIEFAISKTENSKKIWQQWQKRLAELMRNHEYSQDEKNKLAKKIILECLKKDK